MSHECINPEFREWIRLIAESSDAEVAALDFGDEVGYAEMCESRLHWNCCPSCRHEFTSLPSVAERAGRGYEKLLAGDFEKFRGDFLAEKDSIIASGGDDAYIRLIVELAGAESDVHDSLRRVLMVVQNLYRGEEIGFHPDKREILSECRDFVASLDTGVRQFIRATTLCFELVRPMWEKVGHSPRFDPRSPEQIEADLASELARLGFNVGGEPSSLTAQEEAGEEEPAVDVRENLRAAIAESGLEPRVLWEVIEAASSASTTGGHVTGIESLVERKFRELDDDVDSIKAGQMAIIRLSERSVRKAEEYEPEISARIGQPLYSRLTEMTRRLLNVAEFFYHVNSQEPNHFDPPVMKMAMAYEYELKESVVVPILKELLASGEKNYGDDKPLIRQGDINERALTTGTIAWYLRKDATFASKVCARGLSPEAIVKDANTVKWYRDRAAHDLACERAMADELRARVLRPDGVFSRLHSAIGPK